MQLLRGRLTVGLTVGQNGGLPRAAHLDVSQAAQQLNALLRQLLLLLPAFALPALR
jgi:hypothetical protein